MALISPEMGATGRYTLKPPFSLNNAILYTCIAKRSFADCEKRGDDVYTRYYFDRGLVEGQNGFNFDSERANGTEIVTLQGQDGSFYWVPSSYISTWPNVAEVAYHHLILSCSMGALPAGFEYQAVIDELQDTVRTLTGVSGAEVEVAVAPVTANPTTQEHLDMERTRLGNISVNASVSEQLAIARQTETQLREYISQLEAILRQNNIG